MFVVTGAAGFIGSCFLRYLNELGYHHIIVVDTLGNDDKWRNLVGKRFVDFIDKSEMFYWLEECGADVKAIVHLGACSSTVETDADYLLENNYRYSVMLAEWALEHDVRFVYASSAATYGDGCLGFSDDHAALEALQPLNMYGYSKHMFDLWAQRHGVLDKLCGLKYFNVFGPNEFHKGRMASAITHLLSQVQESGVVKLFRSSDPQNFGDGEQKRDFLYVKDAVRMTYALLQSAATGIYNVGSGVPSTWNALAAGVFKAVDKPVNIEYIAMPEDLLGKYQNYTCADMEKTRAVLGAEAETKPLSDAVVEYVRDYLLPNKTW